MMSSVALGELCLALETNWGPGFSKTWAFYQESQRGAIGCIMGNIGYNDFAG